jgi:hypothetical protein
MPRTAALVVLLALAAPVAAAQAAGADPQCLVSFEAARLDVCSGLVSTIDPSIDALADPARFRDARLRLVKFAAPIRPGQRAAVEAAGARILGYAPRSAYVVESSPAQDATLSAVPGVLWVGPFPPAFKIDPDLARELGGARIAQHAGLSRIAIELVPGRAAAPMLTAIREWPALEPEGARLVRDHMRLSARIRDGDLGQAIAALAARDDVLWIGLEWPVGLLNTEGSWLHQGGAPGERPLFDRGLFGCGEVIAVADTGVHVGHCAFVDPSRVPQVSACDGGDLCPAQPTDPSHRKFAAYYRWSGTPGGAPGDAHGHGTHVAGSAAGSNIQAPADCALLSSPGNAANVDGMAPGARLVVQELGPGLQYLNALGGNLYHAASIAYGNGARIHNNSWGSGCRSGATGACIPGCQIGYRSHSRDADAVVWDHPELAVFAAAGNSGSGCGPGADVSSPGNGKNVFSIGANLRGASGDSMWASSSRGPTADRRTKPDLAAQGAGVRSARYLTDCQDWAYSGTSMASPTAAGIAALVREYLRRGFYPSGVETPGDALPDPSAALIKAILINGARAIAGNGSGGGAPSMSQGWGQVDAARALGLAGGPGTLWIADVKDGLAGGEEHWHVLELATSRPASVTLVWHDPPAMLGADPHLVNALRLEVVDPDGLTWSQKLPPGGGPEDARPYQSPDAFAHDDRNNVHRIAFAAPRAGRYVIRVAGIEVAMGDRQPYAIAARGAILASATRVPPAPVPVIEHLEPAQVVAESGSATIAITGSGFQPHSAAWLDDSPLATHWLDGGHLEAEIPARLLEWPGLALIRVFTPVPGGGLSEPFPLQILPHPDRVFRSGFEPPVR